MEHDEAFSLIGPLSTVQLFKIEEILIFEILQKSEVEQRVAEIIIH